MIESSKVISLIGFDNLLLSREVVGENIDHYKNDQTIEDTKQTSQTRSTTTESQHQSQLHKSEPLTRTDINTSSINLGTLGDDFGWPRTRRKKRRRLRSTISSYDNERSAAGLPVEARQEVEDHDEEIIHSADIQSEKQQSQGTDSHPISLCNILSRSSTTQTNELIERNSSTTNCSKEGQNDDNELEGAQNFHKNNPSIITTDLNVDSSSNSSTEEKISNTKKQLAKCKQKKKRTKYIVDYNSNLKQINLKLTYNLNNNDNQLIKPKQEQQLSLQLHSQKQSRSFPKTVLKNLIKSAGFYILASSSALAAIVALATTAVAANDSSETAHNKQASPWIGTMRGSHQWDNGSQFGSGFLSPEARACVTATYLCVLIVNNTWRDCNLLETLCNQTTKNNNNYLLEHQKQQLANTMNFNKGQMLVAENTDEYQSHLRTQTKLHQQHDYPDFAYTKSIPLIRETPSNTKSLDWPSDSAIDEDRIHSMSLDELTELVALASSIQQSNSAGKFTLVTKPDEDGESSSMSRQSHLRPVDSSEAKPSIETQNSRQADRSTIGLRRFPKTSNSYQQDFELTGSNTEEADYFDSIAQADSPSGPVVNSRFALGSSSGLNTPTTNTNTRPATSNDIASTGASMPDIVNKSSSSDLQRNLSNVVVGVANSTHWNNHQQQLLIESSSQPNQPTSNPASSLSSSTASTSSSVGLLPTWFSRPFRGWGSYWIWHPSGNVAASAAASESPSSSGGAASPFESPREKSSPLVVGPPAEPSAMIQTLRPNNELSNGNNKDEQISSQLQVATGYQSESSPEEMLILTTGSNSTINQSTGDSSQLEFIISQPGQHLVQQIPDRKNTNTNNNNNRVQSTSAHLEMSNQQYNNNHLQKQQQHYNQVHKFMELRPQNGGPNQLANQQQQQPSNYRTDPKMPVVSPTMESPNTDATSMIACKCEPNGPALYLGSSSFGAYPDCRFQCSEFQAASQQHANANANVIVVGPSQPSSPGGVSSLMIDQQEPLMESQSTRPISSSETSQAPISTVPSVMMGTIVAAGVGQGQSMTSSSPPSNNLASNGMLTIQSNGLSQNPPSQIVAVSSSGSQMTLGSGGQTQLMPGATTGGSASKVSPPLEVSFILYTRYHRDWANEMARLSGAGAESMATMASNNLVSGGELIDLTNETVRGPLRFNASLPIKVVIHGFGSGARRPWVADMVYKLLEYEDLNVIVVDWEKGATLPNYVQAAGNTRLVGHKIAKLVLNLNNKFSLTGQSYHFIGFSLGAHVAGFAGMEIRNASQHGMPVINRITGLDPASPLFEGYEANDRLDPSDAQFVDVIHSNGDGVLRGGFGSLQPMGHVDFYPNGGRVQVGCNSVLLSALSDIIYGKWQSLCNHRRALNFFMDSFEYGKCRFKSFNCDSYESYLRGECFDCGHDNKKCSYMGYLANYSRGQGKMYLTTHEEAPFCANQFIIKLIGTKGYKTTWGKIEVTLVTVDGKNESFWLSPNSHNQQSSTQNHNQQQQQQGNSLLSNQQAISSSASLILNSANNINNNNLNNLQESSGSLGGSNSIINQQQQKDAPYQMSLQSLIVAHPSLTNFTKVLLRYTRYKGWIYSGDESWSIDKVFIMDSDGQVKSFCGPNTILESHITTRVNLEPGNCTVSEPPCCPNNSNTINNNNLGRGTISSGSNNQQIGVQSDDPSVGGHHQNSVQEESLDEPILINNNVGPPSTNNKNKGSRQQQAVALRGPRLFTMLNDPTSIRLASNHHHHLHSSNQGNNNLNHNNNDNNMNNHNINNNNNNSNKNLASVSNLPLQFVGGTSGHAFLRHVPLLRDRSHSIRNVMGGNSHSTPQITTNQQKAYLAKQQQQLGYQTTKYHSNYPFVAL